MELKPQTISKTDNFFGGDVNKLLPPYDEIPQEFKGWKKNKWCEIIEEWFFKGLPKDTVFIPKADIDTDMALKHIHSIMRSFRPRQEHKVAGCAYLMSLWFDEVKIKE